MQHRQAILWAHVATLRALELRALVPRGHDGEDREREQHREPAAVQELAIDAMKNMNMIMGNTIANSTAANLLRICHRYTVTRIDVMIIVIVSAKP